MKIRVEEEGPYEVVGISFKAPLVMVIYYDTVLQQLMTEKLEKVEIVDVHLGGKFVFCSPKVNASSINVSSIVQGIYWLPLIETFTAEEYIDLWDRDPKQSKRFAMLFADHFAS